jgi:hypothetical protein
MSQKTWFKMLSLICPSTYALLASAAGFLLFIVLPASVRPRADFRSSVSFHRAAPRAATPVQPALLF